MQAKQEAEAKFTILNDEIMKLTNNNTGCTGRKDDVTQDTKKYRARCEGGK